MIANATPVEPPPGKELGLPEHISPTAAKAYLGCSLRFYFERVACIPKPTPPALHVGKAVHRALQVFHLARWRGQDDSVEMVTATYEEARNHTLIERGMGPGEHVYLYTLTYHSWLGHSPGEAPEVREGPDGVRVGVFDGGDALFSEEAVRRRYRRYVLGMARAQIGSTAPEAEAGEGEAGRARLQREIQRLEMDPGHVLWQDGLPEEMEVALEPFRPRLEATWSASTNRVELPLAEHETPWEWR